MNWPSDFPSKHDYCDQYLVASTIDNSFERPQEQQEEYTQCYTSTTTNLMNLGRITTLTKH